jgi:hypothetical protein
LIEYYNKVTGLISDKFLTENGSSIQHEEKESSEFGEIIYNALDTCDVTYEKFVYKAFHLN